MTILFEKDWYDENGKLRAIEHTETKNETFLFMSQTLKKMGIKNHRFMLSLYDPDLRNVDPHALNDQNDPKFRLRYKVAVETKRNVWYYLREVCRVESQGGDPVMFELNRSSIAMTWVFLNGIDYICTQSRQTGKEATLDSLVKTPTGWIRMGDIQVGTIVSTPDGGSAPVIGVYPQGKKDIWRLYFEDGRYADSGWEHLWKVHNRYWEPDDTRWRVVDTKYIIERMKKRPNTEARLSIPVIKPAKLDDVDLPIHPYVMGAYLGDGTSSKNTISICKPDQFLKDELAKYIPKGNLISDWRPDNKSYSINQNPDCSEDERRHFITTLKDLGLHGKRSYEKFIPEIYMDASPEQRLHVLQGLLDTDGGVDDGGSIEYSTTSEILAKQVQALVWSLGGICKRKRRQTYYTHNGERRPGRPSWRLRIRHPDPKSFFRMPRKQDKLSDDYKSKDTFKLGIVGYEYVGQHEAQCISVDHPDNLYITNDYIVTHNTVCALALTTWTIFISGKNSSFGMYTKDDDLRVTNINRVKTFRANLPEYLVVKSRNDKDNAKGLFYAGLKTTYDTIVAQQDKREANKRGRGASAAGWHNDEGAFCKNIEITYPAMLSATNRAREDARRNGQPHSNILTTTAGDPSLPEGKFMKELVDGAIPWTERFLDLPDMEAFHKVVFDGSKEGLVNGTFSHIQLGYSDEWLKKIIARNKLSRDELARDYLNMWVSLATKQIIPKEVLDQMYRARRDPDYVQIVDGYALYWYAPQSVVESAEFRNRSFVLGMDSSDMVGNDFTAFVILDPSTLGVVASFHCNEGNINVVGLFIAQLMVRYPKMVFVPENRSSGQSIIDTIILVFLREGINPFYRIFNDIVNDPDDPRFKDVNLNDPQNATRLWKKHFGIKTNGKKRPFLYGSVLTRAAALAAPHIPDATLIRQLSSLEIVNSRVDHSATGHDDAVIAFLMAAWFVLEAHNLGRYGIDLNKVLIERPSTEDALRLVKQTEQEGYLAEIQKLDRTLGITYDPVVRDILMRKRKYFVSKVDPGYITVPEASDQFRKNPTKALTSKYDSDREQYTEDELIQKIKKLF